ncbi:MAG: hypothetical protein HYX69_03605 [Planctomycetia bacterium]|nr:hypothetical protein [Planctomycetia bacterium]
MDRKRLIATVLLLFAVSGMARVDALWTAKSTALKSSPKIACHCSLPCRTALVRHARDLGRVLLAEGRWQALSEASRDAGCDAALLAISWGPSGSSRPLTLSTLRVKLQV